MRMYGQKTATTLLTLAALALSAAAAQAAFDMEYDFDPAAAKYMKIEKPTPARDFANKVAAYLRLVPAEGKTRVFPVFINSQNYLTCPDTDTRWTLVDVKQVSHERRRGIKVLGFFFDRPTCDKPTFHMKPVVADN